MNRATVLGDSDPLIEQYNREAALYERIERIEHLLELALEILQNRANVPLAEQTQPWYNESTEGDATHGTTLREF